MTRVRVKTLLFSVASITNNHKLGDLKQQVVNLLYFWRSEVQNLSQQVKLSELTILINAGHIREESASLTFPASKDFLLSLAHDLFSS